MKNQQSKRQRALERSGQTQPNLSRKRLPRPRRYKPPADHPRCPLTGKLRYGSMAKAENAIREIILRGPSIIQAYRAYPCADCGGWHLSSKPRHEA